MIYYDRLLDNEPSSVTETHIVEKRKKKTVPTCISIKHFLNVNKKNLLTLKAVDHTVVLLGKDLHHCLGLFLCTGYTHLQLLHGCQGIQTT